MAEEYTPLTNDAAEKVVANALGKAFPNKAIDIAGILAIITALVPIITGCFGRSAKRSIKQGNTNALVASYRAALDAGHGPAESVRVAVALREEAMATPQADIDDFVDSLSDFRG